MARPIALSTGVYHLNIRVPTDLAAKARGSRVTLPVAGAPTPVKICCILFLTVAIVRMTIEELRQTTSRAPLAGMAGLTGVERLYAGEVEANVAYK